MRRVRIFGAVLVAVLALAAVAGSVSASAAVKTVLCSTAAEPCPAASQRAPQGFEATSTSVTIGTSGLGNVVCSQSTLKGETTATEGSPLPVKFSSLSLGGCKDESGPECEVSEVHAPGSGTLQWTSKSFNGELKAESGWKVKVICGGLVNCEFSGAVPMKASTNALTASGVPLTPGGGFFCPRSATLSGTYSVSKPKPFYVSYSAAGAIAFCKTSANAPLCSAGDLYPVGTGFDAETGKVVIGNPVYPITCKSMTVGGSIGADDPEGNALLQTEEHLNGCSVTTSTTCEPKLSSIGWKMSYSEGEALGSSASPQTLSFLCGSALNGSYRWITPLSRIASGSPATFHLRPSPVLLECIGGNMCNEGELIGMSVGSFTITSPNPLYVTHL